MSGRISPSHARVLPICPPETEAAMVATLALFGFSMARRRYPVPISARYRRAARQNVFLTGYRGQPPGHMNWHFSLRGNRRMHAGQWLEKLHKVIGRALRSERKAPIPAI